MSSSDQRPLPARRPSPPIAAVLALAAAAVVGAVLGYQAVTASSSSTAAHLLPTTISGAPVPDPGGVQAGNRPAPDVRPPQGGTERAVPRGVTVDDGLVPDGVTVFDDQYPAVAGLDADLLGALRRAATAAADDGLEISVNSGWRSPAYQDQLLREAVAEYGSEEEAARWVATADTSAHVSGDAVDVGPSDAAAWLSEHGAGFGLCQIYGNEPWHFELRPEAVDDGCPDPYADPTHDPRMHQ